MVFSLIIIRFFVFLIFLFGASIVYTTFLMRKYNYMLEKRNDIVKAYNDFIVLYDGERYFSKKELKNWHQEYNYIKSNIIDYRKFIDGLRGLNKSTKIVNNFLEQYLILFLLPKQYEEIINYLFNVFENGAQLVDSRNDSWMDAELARYEQFFDDQDGRSLTSGQRRAIVVDEANNLAVAGAGTGKTLTLVSKIGYLLEKRLAKPDEIIVFAFASKAKEELDERIKRIHDVEIKVRTFHSFGYEVIGKTTGSKPPLSELSNDDALLQKTLQSFLQAHMSEVDFVNSLSKYFNYFLKPIENDLDISTQSEYEDYLRTVQIRTLRGERVKSLAELELANFFYMYGVDYEYEKKYVVDTSTETRRQYEPDFYLPGVNIWIEHIGIDRECNTSPEVDRWEYLDSWYWKRRIHRENSTELLETYSYQHSEGTLIEDLRPQLEVRGVQFHKIPEELVFDRLKSLGEVTQFIGLVAKFLRLFKSSTFTVQDLREKASKYPYAQRYQAFLNIFEPLLDDYENLLSSTCEIDFDDMINYATELIQSRAYQSPFKYILIDEFQDISQSRYRLIKSLIDQDWRTKTFCVGDDWQSIYRFTGSDLSIMTSFEKYFEPCEVMFLNETFRFNERIADFSSKFITVNPSQYEKKLVSKPSMDKAVTLVWYGDLMEALTQAIKEIKRESADSEIFLLSRYNKEFYRELDNSFYEFLGSRQGTNPRMEMFTIHSSKGKEADSVILFGLQSGSYGLPCEVEDDPLINLVLAEDDKYPNAEERRVFYVGMTRARDKVYLLANRDRISSFVTEILSEEYDLRVLGDPPKLVRCPECRKGVINRIPWNDDVFFSCSRYPSCRYRPLKCPVCRVGFLYLETETDEYYKCSNDDCSYQPKKCPECNGYLVRRSGTPDFYGCSNYSTTGCRYKAAL